jgi:hypothetical protein
MTDNSFPTVPPPELVEQWIKSARYREFMPYPEGYEQYEQRLTTIAAQWGADQELAACCEWVSKYLPYLGDFPMPEDKLRAARRPEPPKSLKEQALGALSRADKDALTNPLTGKVVDLRTILSKEQSDTIRKALEALPND